MQLLQSVLLPRPRGCLSNLSAVQQPLGQLKVSAIGLESKEQNFIEEYELKTFDRDFINIAQIITEQIAFATLGIFYTFLRRNYSDHY
jgi:hypothetical protein